MTDEKKSDDILKSAEDKKSAMEEEGKEKLVEKKVETKTEEVKKTVKKEDVISGEKDTKNSPKKEKVAEGKSEENETTGKAKQGQDKKTKKDLGNLNFYPELRTDIPVIKSGDVLKVFYRVVEGGKERIQIFEGIVIAMKNGGIARTITVRKTSFGISIERIFPLNSKLVQKIEVIKRSKVRRSKLYYLRKLKGKAARLKELR